MYNGNKPRLSELPTTAQLLKSTVLAAGVAGTLLVTVVLPAEYGVDPTRVGSVFGLTEMGRIKRQLAAEAVADARADAAVAPATQTALAVASSASGAALPPAAAGAPAPPGGAAPPSP